MDASIKWLARGIVEAVTAQVDILGYVLCEVCEEPVPTEVAKVTGGRCGECTRALLGPRIEKLDVLVEGARSTVAIGGPRKRSGSKGNPKTRRKVEAAKRRALRRLRHAHPEEYELLLANERGKVGLEPVPLGRAVMVGTVIDSTAYDSLNGAPDSNA